MKHFYFFSLVMIIFILGSCTSSQFSTSERRVKNGHVTYVNKHSHDRIRVLHASKVNARSNENQSISNVDKVADDNRVDEINRISNLNSTKVDDQLIASTSKDLLLPVTNKKVILFNDYSGSTKQSSSGKVGSSKRSHKSETSQSNYYYANQARPDTTIGNKHYSEVNQPKKHVAIGGLVCSIIGLFIAGVILGTVGIISGAVGISKVNKHPEKYTGKGTAIASLIIGIIALVGEIVVLALLLPIL